MKVIAKFLNNEPRYLEPMLEMLLMNQSYMNWQERYIILLWSSHLVLTPFDLASISSSDKPSLMEAKIPEELESNRLPLISVALISAGLKNLGAASKERESASRLLVRVVLRPDMQRLGLLDKLVTLMYTKLQHYTQNPTASMYECLGFLSILSGITKSGSAQDTAPFLTTIFDFCLKAATDEEAKYGMIRTSAPARKMLIVILRTSTLHALSLYSRNGAKVMSEGNVYRMLEESIQYLLQALADKDTPVRFAASKALSMLCQSLDDDMKTEVVQAVLDTLEEDILYEKPESGNPVPATFLTTEERQKMSRNVMGVNPLKWQGLLLTLSQFLFRRTAPPDQLSPILGSLLSGLDFEQRSSSGTSIGGSVRDAACFGLWSLARKYATSELGSTDPTIVSPAIRNTISVNDKPSVLQTIANQLVVSACLDPSGNIRRGSSAALQELIGRHPDTIIHGIALVQAVDYHAVARRSHALVDVTRGAAELHDVYRWALLNALLGWRGIRAVDDDSRRTAALAITRLVSLGSFSDCSAILETAQEQLMRLPVQNSKTIAETRHGLLMTISCVLENLDSAGHRIQEAGACFSITSFLQLLWEHVRIDGQLFGNIKGRFTSELMLEGAARLISSLTCTEPEGHFKSFEQVIEVLDLCLTRADNDITLVACADAAFQLFSKLTVPQRAEVVDKWLKTDRQRHPSFSCKGRILAFGTVYSTLPEEALSDYSSQRDDCGSRVLAQVRDFIQGDWPIETQVIALRSLTSMISELTEEAVVEPLCAALDNYTNDQRGDVGSLARMEGVKGSSVLLSKYAEGGSSISNLAYVQPLVQRLFRLAGEKLDKLRFEAWKCIEAFLKVMKMQCNQS